MSRNLCGVSCPRSVLLNKSTGGLIGANRTHRLPGFDRKWRVMTLDESMSDSALAETLIPSDLGELIRGQGYSEDEFRGLASGSDVLILPDSTRLPFGDEDCLELLQTETVTLLKKLRQQGLRAELLLDRSKKRRYLSLRSADFVFPLMLLLGDASVQVALNLLASFIWDTFVVARRGIPGAVTVECEYEYIGDGHQQRVKRRISGPASDVVELLRNEPGVLTAILTTAPDSSISQLPAGTQASASPQKAKRDKG